MTATTRRTLSIALWAVMGLALLARVVVGDWAAIVFAIVLAIPLTIAIVLSTTRRLL